MMLKEVPAPRSSSTMSTSRARILFRTRTFCGCLMFAAARKSEAPLIETQAGTPGVHRDVLDPLDAPADEVAEGAVGGG